MPALSYRANDTHRRGSDATLRGIGPDHHEEHELASKKKITVGVAGEAGTDLNTLKAVLNDWFGYGEEGKDGFPAPSANEIEFLIPGPTGLTDSVKTFMKWADYVDAPYTLVTDDAESRAVRGLVRNAYEVETTKNVGATMIELLEKAEGDKYLFLAWGEAEGSDDFSESLLELAEAAGIPVKDLTGGLDDISYRDEDEPEEEEPEEPRKGSEQPLEDEEVPLEDLPADEAQQLPPGTFPPAGIGGGPLSPLDTLEKVYAYLYHQDEMNAARNLAPMRRTPLTDLVLQTITQIKEAKPFTEALKAEEVEVLKKTLEEVAEEETPKRGSRGRPRKDGSPAQPRPRTEEEATVAYIKEADGGYRKRGRGRTRKGEEVVHLTLSEIADLGLDD
jgi:hypothetical protein